MTITTKRNSKVAIGILACLVMLCRIPFGSSFVAVRMTRTRVLTPKLANMNAFPSTTISHQRMTTYIYNNVSVSIRAQQGDEDDTSADNFDGKGFANYLLPYAIALIGSIAATAAVFKFVLLDY